MKEKILLFKGVYQYDVVNYFIDDLSEGFNKLGYITEIFIINDINDFNNFYNKYNHSNVLFYLAFNGILMPYLGQLATHFKKPLITIYLDSSIYHIDRLKYKSDYVKIFFIDKSEIKLLKKMIEYDSFFLPHGAVTNKVLINNNDKKGIIFAASINNPDIYREKWLKLESNLSSFFENLMKFNLNKDYFNILRDIDYILKRGNCNINDELKRTLYFYSLYLHRYLRYYKRIKLLNCLKDYKIDIYGNGWDTIPLSKNHKYHGSLDFIELLKKIKKSKILLNVMPEFVYGGHERIFTAMYNGTAVITNSNTYLKNNFEDGNDLVFYSFSKLDEIKSKIDLLLNNENYLNKISYAGQKKVSENHTWHNRAKEILKMISVTT